MYLWIIKRFSIACASVIKQRKYCCSKMSWKARHMGNLLNHFEDEVVLDFATDCSYQMLRRWIKCETHKVKSHKVKANCIFFENSFVIFLTDLWIKIFDLCWWSKCHNSFETNRSFCHLYGTWNVWKFGLRCTLSYSLPMDFFPNTLYIAR